MEQIHVLVIDDSAFMRKMISDIIESDPRLQVIGTARNGETGIQKMKELSPDVITMDVNMPVMDGIHALQEIMRTNPVPVIMLASQTANVTENTIKAIENGAVDFIMKPSGEISLNIEMIKNEIISKIIAASFARLSTDYKLEKINLVTQQTACFIQPPRTPNKQTIVLLGTSTGGPRALQKVLTSLPKDFNTPFLIVQHMPAGFTKSLAKRLDTLCHFHVKEAEHGETLKRKTVYIAPGDYHMRVKLNGSSELVIENSKDEPINNHRPSVDALFESVSYLKNVNKVAVILTGMGNDGSKGIKKLKQMDKNCMVISEAKETAIIYGMPKAAYETGAVDHVLPLDQIGELLGRMTQSLIK